MMTNLHSRHRDAFRYKDELPTVNRCAVVLEPTSAYLEWAKSCPEGDEGLTLDEVREEGTVYLIPEVDAEPETWLKRNYKAMFEHELESWCTDDAFWPEDRSFKAFKGFFDIRFCSMVLDMGKGAIERDGE